MEISEERIAGRQTKAEIKQRSGNGRCERGERDTAQNREMKEKGKKKEENWQEDHRGN